jgi:hypothetical protein
MVQLISMPLSRLSRRCTQLCLQPVVRDFALWLAFWLDGSSFELFDEVLPKQKAAILHCR